MTLGDRKESFITSPNVANDSFGTSGVPLPAQDAVKGAFTAFR